MVSKRVNCLEREFIIYKSAISAENKSRNIRKKLKHYEKTCKSYCNTFYMAIFWRFFIWTAYNG
ncbi:hypothetical protein GCM10022217_24670 [Chryseobacterium ginsenosidimutans]